MNTRRQTNTPAKGAQPLQQQQQQQKQVTQQANPVQKVEPEPPAAADGAASKKEKPLWQLKKVNPELKRLRQNARVKKVVRPKTAIMVLNELYPELVYKLDEIASNKTSIFRVHFELNDKTFCGEGFSKSQAKQTACENALKALLLEKLSKEKEAEKNEVKMETDDEENGGGRKIPTDDFPWGKLAAFALQKLLEDCKSPKNPELPIVPPVPAYVPHQAFPQNPNHVSFSNFGQNFAKQPFQNNPVKKTKTITPRKKFPENPLEHNPVVLFCQTWPQAEPVFDSRTGADGKPEHAVSLVLEGYRIIAQGKNKKEVKLQLAKAAISTLKGVRYPDNFEAQVTRA